MPKSVDTENCSFACGAIAIGDAFVFLDPQGNEIVSGVARNIRYGLDWNMSAIVDETGRVCKVAPGATVTTRHYEGRTVRAFVVPIVGHHTRVFVASPILP